MDEEDEEEDVVEEDEEEEEADVNLSPSFWKCEGQLQRCDACRFHTHV